MALFPIFPFSITFVLLNTKIEKKNTWNCILQAVRSISLSKSRNGTYFQKYFFLLPKVPNFTNEKFLLNKMDQIRTIGSSIIDKSFHNTWQIWHIWPFKS